MAWVLPFLFLFGYSPLQSGDRWDEARFRLNCPQAPCWRYWDGNCYCLEENEKGTWAEALRFCKRYSYTELISFTSPQEMNWILDLPLDNFWTGLNNLEHINTFSWSEGTPANVTLPWLQLSLPAWPNTVRCVKVSKHRLVAFHCNAKVHWICKRSAFVDRYQEHKGKVLLSPLGSASQVHADLISAKAACLELREQCTGITVWNNAYAIARGTVLLKSEESWSAAYVKSDCALGYFGKNCSSVCSMCYGDELCNPYTGVCDNFHSCRAQDSPTICEQDMKSAWCPRFSGWKYWGDSCYYFSDVKVSWVDARKQCRRFRSTDLIWLESRSEMNWIFSASSAELFWTGLNSRKQKSIWIWSDTKSAAKVLHWLELQESPFGRCVGLNSVNQTALRLDCEEKYKWICKRREVDNLFDVYMDQFLSGPLEPVFYTSLSAAALDCLSDANCTGIVQDYLYYRRTTGVDIIVTYEEIATTYVRRECDFGYYGYNCSSDCKKCYGGFRCNSVTGRCPERMQCIGQFKGELCELGIWNPKCPQNAPWWFYDGHCYYFEKEMKQQHAGASVQCSYYKDGNLVKIDSEKEQKWLSAMLETESWIGLLQEGVTWKWSGGQEDVDKSKYTWLWDFPATANGCVQMVRGGRLRALSCSEQHFYVCEKEIAGLDLFIDYPGKIMLAVYPLAVYNDLEEAKFHCVLRVNCTGISSWPNKHFLVTGMEMVLGLAHHVFHLKTSCSPGHHGYVCGKECPICRDNALCNMLTGFCDEKTFCRDTTSIESCSESTVSQRCPDKDKWRYWNRHCYYYSISASAKKPWKEANSSCSRFRAAELLWIEDQDDLKWLQKFFRERIWIGLQDINYDEIWAWSHEDNATSTLKWMNLPRGSKWERCADMSNRGVISKTYCSEKRGWVCKRPAEPDLDIYTGLWDSVVISENPSLSANSTYNQSRDECIRLKSACLGYGLWQNGYFILNGPMLVGGGFGPSVTFFKSACDYGYYGSECEAECPHCHWDKPCHPRTGTCEGPIVCAAPQLVGTCSFGLYSLRCPLGDGWWFWQGKCYLIEKNRKVTWKEAQELCRHFIGTRLLQIQGPEEKTWLKEMISEQIWIGMKWNSQKTLWQWGDETEANTNENWLKIEGSKLDSCGTLLKNKSLLQSAQCSEKLYFICQRQENVNIFHEYNGHIIPKRQNTLPKIFYTFNAAEEDCIFEKTTCTGIVLSQGQYYMVSGTDIFKSPNANDVLYLKSACNPGFYGTNCQFICRKCTNNFPCHPVTGECIVAGITRCTFDSPDPKCDAEAFISPCPKKPQWHYYSKSCYYVEDTKTDTWANARSACQGFKGTDLVKITSSHEKMWVQYKGDESWIGLAFYKRSYQYLWVDNTSSVFQNAWVVRRNRRYTQSVSDCGVAFKRYLSVTDCSLHKKWICKRKDVDLFSELIGRAFYLPHGEAPTYSTLNRAKQACLILQKCTGVVEAGNNFMLHTGVDIYNTRDNKVKTWIKSDCAAGRFGENCEQICHRCDDDVLCNPYTGLCGDSLFCNKNDPTFTCEKGTLMGGRCPVEDGWVYWHGNCYYFPKETEKIWLDARDMCRRYRDTDLLWISSRDEMTALLSILPRGVYWIGLHGDRFCTRLQWSKANISYADSEWLRKKSWTLYWMCCVQLNVPKGSMPGTSCYGKGSWVCKKTEEENMDFRKFNGYYLTGIVNNTKVATHKSLSKAFQQCRYERNLCTGVQRIRATYTTFLAKRLVFVNGSFAKLYTAYLKTACTPGYYGPECSINCTCNGTENCNPITGQCSDNEQCNEDYIATDCEEGVINLKCPTDPGWWYWKDNCYYIETVKHLTWSEANDFCMAYDKTELMPLPQRKEERVWLTSVIKGATWIGSAVAKVKETTNIENMYRKAPSTCTQMRKNGPLEEISCSSLALWVCKRSVDAKMFWLYPGKMLILPLGDKMYKQREHAKSACLLEEKCTGISYWKKQYIPVSGNELILTNSKKDAAFMKTACQAGRYGAYCQERCPECPKDRPCNRLTGNCSGDVTCSENDLRLCEIKLKSKFCYYTWTYFNGHCYYISTYGQINHSDAVYMCSQFKGSQLLHLTNTQEKDWLVKAVSKKFWLLDVGPAFQPKLWLSQTEEKLAERTLVDTELLCLQMEPGVGYLMSAPCSSNASWICKAPLASEPVDCPDKWWLSLASSLLGTTAVLVVTVILTFKYGFWASQVVNEAKMQTP
ncbi:uncharacterized protein LOC133378773 [Rhineura floridana]|uniref:uncharacterized protein LOC133378773 n=1 Tax=Rhineura floridana TaxID=261503 RepID=UPI002AC8322C|nr:uncharacterized protein LOC133378773 [Rhineura floridana]